MHAHDGRVYHLDGRIESGSKCVHGPPPHSRPSPPDETVVAGGAWAIASGRPRHGAPDRSTQQMPSRTRRSGSLAGQERTIENWFTKGLGIDGTAQKALRDRFLSSK
jgi:hypothetical protein